MKKIITLLVAISMTFIMGCTELLDSLSEPTPTKNLMEGVWEVVAVTEVEGTDTLDIYDTLRLDFPINPYIHIKDNTYFNSTAGPLFLYLVYGRSKWTQVTSLMDQMFNYAQLTTTDGRWITQEGIVDSFDLKVTLTPPGSQTFKSVLELFGVASGYLETYLDHDFSGVWVSFEGMDSDTMYWEWDDAVTADYYNVYGDIWLGWEATKFSRCKIKMVKRVKTLNELINEHYDNQ